PNTMVSVEQTNRRGRSVAFGGSELSGLNMARTLFLDEAGMSRPKDEPFVVVAGGMIHHDSQWKPIQDPLWHMIVESVPKERWNGAYFHAHKMYHGRSPFDAASGWDEAKRFRVLHQLAGMPWQHRLPVFHAWVDRQKHAERPYNDWLPDKSQEA